MGHAPRHVCAAMCTDMHMNMPRHVHVQTCVRRRVPEIFLGMRAGMACGHAFGRMNTRGRDGDRYVYIDMCIDMHVQTCVQTCV